MTEIKYIVKQLLMLEDKLFNTKKTCKPCIFEHMMLIEALIQNLMKEKTNKIYPVFVETLTKLRELEKDLRGKKKDMTTAVQDVRTLRKKITKDHLNMKKFSSTEIKREINHKCKTDILPILNPLFNFREAEKNVLLLLDHLLIKEHRCQQCHRKHSLLIEAFLEEAATLDLTGKYKKMLKELQDSIRKVQVYVVTGRSKYGDAVTELKKMDKKLFPYSMKFLEEISK